MGEVHEVHRIKAQAGIGLLTALRSLDQAIADLGLKTEICLLSFDRADALKFQQALRAAERADDRHEFVRRQSFRPAAPLECEELEFSKRLYIAFWRDDEG